MKTFIIDLIIFAIIMAIFLIGLPKQEGAPLLRAADVVVDRPKGDIKLCERIMPLDAETGRGVKIFSYADLIQNPSGTVRWQLQLTGTFEEQNGEYVCTDAQYETMIYNTLYYEKDAELIFDGDTATCVLTIGKRLFGIPLGSDVYQITLTCASDGTLS